MTKDTETNNIIKSILNVHCREGATISDIQSDYEEVTGEPLLDAYNRLNSIDHAYCIIDSRSEPKWFVKSDTMEHLTKLIMEQKPQQRTSFQRESFQSKPIRPQKNLNHSFKENDCFFKDNIAYKHMRKYKRIPLPWNNEINNNNSFQSYKPKLSEPSPPKRCKIALDAQLVGDDFFRTLACNSTVHGLGRKSGVQQTGLCVSGLSIRAAANLVDSTPSFKSNRLILNIGSVDILHGHNLFEMCFDLKYLITVCKRRGLQPIITTLAPLANIGHSPEMVNKLLNFNEFLREKYILHSIIDIWPTLTSARGLTNFDCFETEPTYVSGSNRPHILWSETGRALIRAHIHRSLKTILKMNTVYVDA